MTSLLRITRTRSRLKHKLKRLKNKTKRKNDKNYVNINELIRLNRLRLIKMLISFNRFNKRLKCNLRAFSINSAYANIRNANKIMSMNN